MESEQAVMPLRPPKANEVEVFGFNVFNDTLDAIPLERPCRTLNTISPISYGITTKDPVFRQALRETDYLVLDGVYFALGSILTRGQKIKPNQGPDVFFYYMEKLNKIGGRGFYLGASDATLRKMEAEAAKRYPNVTIASYSPPFKPEFSDADNDAMIEAINAFKPDVLFIGMTAPKQEKWAWEHRDRLDAGLTVAIGAVFDWFAGNRKMIAPIWFKLRLAWLVRVIQRPEILLRYNFKGIFIRDLFLNVLGLKKIPADRDVA